jgi:Lrp/AsnC family leucine-responsive transcriptional regulator
MDEIDRKIITQLQSDGRTTLEELSKLTGYTNVGVKKRLQNLVKRGTIKIQALINPTILGLYPALVMLEMEDAQAQQNLIERFEECPRVIQIFKTIGGYNLIALVMAETKETQESISTEKCSLRCSKGIRRSEFYPISETCYSPFYQIREGLANKKSQKTPCNVDCDPCKRYKTKKCVGCPATIHYRGTL